MNRLIPHLRWLSALPHFRIPAYSCEILEALADAADALEEASRPRGALKGEICSDCDGYGYHASHSDVCKVCGGFGNVIAQGGQTRKAKHVQAREDA